VSVEIMAWNIADGFSDKDRYEGIVEVVTERMPDAIIFSEAWHQDQVAWLGEAARHFMSAGYNLRHTKYEDDEDRDDRHGLLAMVHRRAWGGHSSVVRISGRNALMMGMKDPATGARFNFYGAHLNDRSEASRLSQVAAMIRALNIVGGDNPVVVAGDLNASYRKGLVPGAFRLVGPLFKDVPVVNYAPGYKPDRLTFAADSLRRAGEMAIGSTMQAFRDEGFKDAHPGHRPTISLLNLDHILVRGPRVIDSEVLPKTPLSDHRAITATLEVEA